MDRATHESPATASPLADLLVAEAEEITARWSARAVEGLGERLLGAALVDHIPGLIGELATSLRAGRPTPGAGEEAPGRQHGRQRHRVGAVLEQVVREYGLLRDVILELAEEHAVAVSVHDFRVFTDVLGRAVAESVTEFVAAREAAEREAGAAVVEREQRLRQLAEAMPQMVWTADAAGRLDYLNGRWLSYTGAAPEAALEEASSAIHPDDVERVVQLWRRSTSAGEPYETEYRLRRFDGTYRWHLARGVPIRGSAGRIERWFGTTTDVHDLKRLEEALCESDRRKSEFLAVLSHELRNPLAPIRHSISVLEHDHDAGRVRHAHEVIRRQTEHLARLTDDLLDVTRMSRGKVELRCARVDLDEVIRQAAEDHRSHFEERGIALAVAGAGRPVWVDGDGTRLEQIVGNLLQNAAKFTPCGGHAELALTLSADAARAEIHVRDDGAGVDPAVGARVFEAFVQGEHTLARTGGGLGLGLALVKGLAELHGGFATVASAGRGRGAEFTVSLPLAPALAAAPGGSSGARAGAPFPRQVLVVDDNRDAADSLAQLIALRGHRVDVAYDGPTALEKVKARRPDVVLCDIGLPGMSGYDVARAVRRLDGGGIRLVAVSGYSRPDDLRAASEAGFDRHVSKPADPDDLDGLLA